MNIGIGIGIGGSGLPAPRVVVPPSISIPVAISGQTATVDDGSFTIGGGAIERRWGTVQTGLIGGATGITYLVTNNERAERLYCEVRVYGRRWSSWVRSNEIAIAGVSPYLTASEWETGEATTDKTNPFTDVAFLEADTRKTIINVAASFKPGGAETVVRGYTGATAPGTPTTGNTTVLTDSGGGFLSMLSGTQAALGETVYTRLWWYNTGTLTFTAATDIISWQASDVPDEATVVWTASTGTGSTGDVTVNITTLPSAERQPILAIEYDVDGSGTGITLPGGLVAGARTINFGTGALRALRLNFRNANGWSGWSGAISVLPKPAPASLPAPVISLYSLNVGPNTVDVTCDQPGTFFNIWNLSATTLSGAAIEAAYAAAAGKVQGAIGYGISSFTPDLTQLTTATWYSHITVKNTEGTFAANLAPISFAVTAPVVSPSRLQSAVFDQTQVGSTSNHSLTLPGGIVAGSTLLLMIANGGAGGAGPSGWTQQAAGNNARLYKKTAAGTEGGTTVTWTTGSAVPSCATFYELNLPNGFLETANTASSIDPPSLTPSQGSREYLWLCFAVREQSANLLTPGAGYGNALISRSSSPGTSSSAQRRIGSGEKIATASSDDPAIFTGGAGSATLSITLAGR